MDEGPDWGPLLQIHNRKFRTYTPPATSAQNIPFSDTPYMSPWPLWTLTASLFFFFFFFWFSHVCKVDGFPEFWGPHSSLSLTGQGLLCMCESRGPLSGKRVVAPGRQLHVISQPLPSLTWWEWKLKTAPQLLKFSWVPSLPVPWCLPTVTPFPLLQTGSPSGTRCYLGFHFLLGLHSLQSSFLTCPQKYPPQKL